MKLCRDDVFFVLIAFFALSVFTFFAFQNVDIQFLGLTSGDELPQFKQLNNVLSGYLGLDLEQMFRIEFYNYGYFYYLLNVLVAAPFNLLEKYEWAIFAPRFLNGVFSVLNLWMVYKISKLYLSKRQSLLLVLFCLLIPGFWHYGYIFKPDVFQAFFVLCSLYFLCLDRFAHKKNFYLSVLFLGFGVGLAKFQAIMFLPLLCLYVFNPFFSKPSFKALWRACYQSCLVVFSVLFLWIVTNPYLLHPTGMKVWWNMFAFNMHSNATNHGAYTDVGLLEKFQMFGQVFLSPIAVGAVGIWGSLMCFKRQINDVWLYVFLAFIISLSYLLVFVNKAWGIYYISTIFLCVILFIPILHQYRFFVIVVFCLQIANLFYFHSFSYFIKPSWVIDKQTKRVSDELVGALGKILPQGERGDISIYTDIPSFEYQRLNLSYKNIYQVFGSLLPWNLNKAEFSKKYPYKNPSKYFKQWDFIVLSKGFVRNNEKIMQRDKDAELSIATLNNLRQYGYTKLVENEDFWIYQYKGSKE